MNSRPSATMSVRRTRAGTWQQGQCRCDSGWPSRGPILSEARPFPTQFPSNAIRFRVHPSDQGADPGGRPRRGPRARSATASRSSTCARPRSAAPATCPGAKHVPRGYLESRIEGAVPDRSQRVVLYCASGNRSALAAQARSRRARLRERRVDDRRHHAVEGPRLRGRRPAQAHARAARALQPPHARARDRRSRASRSCSTRRCCCSAPAASARRPRCTSPPPASARSASSTTTSSTSRTSSARSSTRPTASACRRSTRPRQTIKALNPDVDVVKYQTRLDASNIMEIIEGYDVIVDGVDNFPTRYLLNDATVRLKIPVVSASILGFDGQLSVFEPYEGPCYRCLYPVPPPAELAPSCGANGVLGVLPGTMGLLQATEVVKLVVGAGEPLDRPAAALRGARRDVHRAQGPPRPRVPDLLAASPRRSPTTRWASSRTTRRSAPRLARPRALHGHRSHPTSPAPVHRAARRKSRPPATTSATSCARSPTSTPTAVAALRRRRRLNRYVNVYLNDEDVRVLDGLDTPVGGGDVLVILPAMAGGS